MSGDRGLPARLAQNLRFDGLWWRQFAYLGCVYGPEWWKRYSPPAIGAIIFTLVGRNRRGAIANFERVLAPAGRGEAARAALRMFANFACCFTETMEFYGPRPRPIRVDPPIVNPIAAALTAGRGVVILTAHFGNWDIAAKTLGAYGRPINIVMARESNVTTQEYLRRAREQTGVRVIYSDTSVFSSLNMIRALRQNEIVALQLDRVTGKTRAIPFFGAPAAFPAGPFILARLAGTPLIPVFIPRVGTRHYAIRLGQPLSVPRERGETAALDHAMRSVVAEFEQVVREFPTQWFQFLPFWPPSAAGDVTAIPTEQGDRLGEPRRMRR